MDEHAMEAVKEDDEGVTIRIYVNVSEQCM